MLRDLISRATLDMDVVAIIESDNWMPSKPFPETLVTAVRDVARVLRVPYGEADRLAKMIPPPIQGRHIPLEVSVKENTDLKNEYKNNETAKKVFDLAIRLEGTIRSHGVHAAGVVIAPDDIVKFVPLEKAQKGVIATQYSMNPVEELGLLKMDFLGLSNLTVINNTLRIIRKVFDVDINIDRIPMSTKKPMKCCSRAILPGCSSWSHRA